MQTPKTGFASSEHMYVQKLGTVYLHSSPKWTCVIVILHQYTSYVCYSNN
jgi:hypothetical protein